MDDRTVLSLIEWLIAEGLRGAGERDLLDGLCARLAGCGIPLMRVALASDLLHPTVEARSFLWRRGQGVEREEYPREDEAFDREAWHHSPFFYMLEQRLMKLRCPMHEARWVEAFPLLAQLRAEGATDYVALAVGLGEAARLGEIEGMMGSFVIDRPGGYRDAEIALLERIMPAVALSFHMLAGIGTARTLLNTYLGRGAAARVLAGNISRGRAETIRAVIWYSDLAGFTRIADALEHDGILGLLNDYAECIVEVIEEHGGEVLKFIGDGILAIFPDDDRRQACGRSLAAALAAEARVAALNARRRLAGAPVTEVYLALHEGELLFGNFGSRNRLDFTVLGPAVNEASRIAAMSRSVDQRIMISSAFAEAAGTGRSALVSLGRYALRGVARPQELFTIDREQAVSSMS